MALFESAVGYTLSTRQVWGLISCSLSNYLYAMSMERRRGQHLGQHPGRCLVFAVASISSGNRTLRQQLWYHLEHSPGVDQAWHCRLAAHMSLRLCWYLQTRPNKNGLRDVARVAKTVGLVQGGAQALQGHWCGSDKPSESFTWSGRYYLLRRGEAALDNQHGPRLASRHRSLFQRRQKDDTLSDLTWLPLT